MRCETRSRSARRGAARALRLSQGAYASAQGAADSTLRIVPVLMLVVVGAPSYAYAHVLAGAVGVRRGAGGCGPTVTVKPRRCRAPPAHLPRDGLRDREELRAALAARGGCP